MKKYITNKHTWIASTLVTVAVGIYWGGLIDETQLITGLGVLAGYGVLMNKRKVS